MPIARFASVEASFVRCGTLRKGGEKTSKTQPGPDLDYLRFDPIDDATGAAFEDVYGKQPQAVNVFLPYRTTDENFSYWQEAYSASQLLHRCDGEYCYERDTSGALGKTTKPCPGGCKEVGRLTVIIPELKRFAYVTVLTSSKNDIARLLAQLQAVEMLRSDLRGIPFVLRRTKVSISTPSGSNGQRARRDKWLLSIEVAPVWAAAQLQLMSAQAMPLLNISHDEQHYLAAPDTGEIFESESVVVEEQPKRLTKEEQRQKAIEMFERNLDVCLKAGIRVPVELDSLDFATASNREIYDTAKALEGLINMTRKIDLAISDDTGVPA